MRDDHREHVRPGDMDVNATKERSLRTCAPRGGRDDYLGAPRQMTLELALEYIEDDELIEVTRPHSGCASACWGDGARKLAAARSERWKSREREQVILKWL